MKFWFETITDRLTVAKAREYRTVTDQYLYAEGLLLDAGLLAGEAHVNFVEDQFDRLNGDRDFAKRPIRRAEAILLFIEESFDLALATEDVIAGAARLAETFDRHNIASDIGSRWDDYQEELRCLMEEAREEFGL